MVAFGHDHNDNRPDAVVACHCGSNGHGWHSIFAYFSAATGGDTPLAYSVSGNPAWLTLSGQTLSGTPTAVVTSTIIVTVTDNDGDTDTASFTLTVSAASTVLALADFVIPTGHELATSALIEAGGVDFFYRDDDPTAVETSDSGEILDGDIIPATDYRMSLIRHPDANGFILNDRPEAASIITFFEAGGDGADLTIHVQDDTGVASFVVADTTIFASSDDFIRYTVPDAVETVLARIGSGDLFILAFTRPATVDLMPTAGNTLDQSAVVGTAITINVVAATGGDTPLAYTQTGAPTWATFDDSALTFAGTPDAAGTHTITVTVTDDDGDTDTDSFVLTVTAAADLMPTAGDTTNKSYAVDTDFSFTLVAGTGGDTPLAITVSGLPTGATFDDTDTITGNVSTAGAHTITVTYTDDDGDSDDDTFVLTITSAVVADSTTYRFENIDLSADALEDVFLRFSGNLATAGAWRSQTTGVTPTSNTGPGTNSSGPYVYSESSASSGPAEILTNSKLVMLESIMDTWTGTGRSITLRICIQGTGWSADDEGLRIRTGTTESDATQLVRFTGWDYANDYVVGDTVTNRQDDDYTIVQVGGWIDYTIDIPDGHEHFELASFIVALGSFHLHDLALWQITLTNGAGAVDVDEVPEAPTAPTLTATDTSIEVTLSSDPTSDATITSRDIQWRTGSNAWTEVLGVTSPVTISSLAEETEYDVQWRAVSSAGDGVWSPSGTITTLATDLMPSLPAIADQSATVGTAFSLEFDAATSGDAPLAYSVSGNPAWLTLSDRTLSGTPTATGTHTITITVTDNDGDTDTESFVLTVGTVPNTAPTVSIATAAVFVDGGELVAIAGAVGDAEDDDADVTVTVTASIGTISDLLHSGSGWMADWTAPAVTAAQQSAVITVEAEDSGGLTATATRTWTVRANQAPTVTIGTAGGDVTGGSTTALTATASDPEGQTLTSLWEITAGPGTISQTTSLTGASFSAPAATASDQETTVRITVTDTLGT